MRFPPEFIERLRNHLPISMVIGKRIALRKHGREYQAVCPFHKEKSPSFTVNDEKGFYHCFGCAAHGDAIGFIREYDGLSYPEAIERLASEAGMALPQMTPEAVAQERRRHTLEDVTLLAANWFIEQLATPAGKEARDYLASRDLGSDMIQKFGIGYAPNQREALKSYLIKQGIAEPLIIEAGMLAKSDDGKTYDRFRGRLMFPIRNANGKAIAFGGRILPSAQTDKTAKYLNSPETPLFKKGETLFAYDIARKAAHDSGTLILAEGYMDVIALHKAGFTYAVAPLGTAITEQQLKLLWRTAPEPILCLDGDAAGKRAMMRAAELALPQIKAGFSLRFAYLPAGEDPDSLLRSKGTSAMQTILANPRMLSQALWEEAFTRFGSATAEQKAALEHHLTAQSALIADKVMGQHMQGYFKERLYSVSRTTRKPGPAAPTVPLGALPAINADSIHLKPIENQIVELILRCPALLDMHDIEEQFAHIEFSQSELDKLRAITLEIHADSVSLDTKSLCAALAERGFGEKVDTLLHSEKAVLSTPASPDILSDSNNAARIFEKAYFAYTLKKLEQDKEAAARDMQNNLTDENFARYTALSEQYESLSRSRYSVTPDEQFS